MVLAQRFAIGLGDIIKNLNGALDCFDPMSGRDNSYPERMISYYYIQALAKALPDAKVVLELPVTGRSSRGKDNHIDALVFNDREMVVAEFKVGWAQSHWASLERDLERLCMPSVREDIRACFTDDRRRREFVFLGTDCWRRDRALTWKSGRRSGTSILPQSLSAAKRDFFCVYDEKGKGCDGYYLTWALLPYNSKRSL